MDSARTFVLTHNGRVVELPAYPVGMVLLARLAVDRSEQGKRFRALLLAEALRRAIVAGDAAAARLVVVDAIDDYAARFSQRHGFIAAPNIRDDCLPSERPPGQHRRRHLRDRVGAGRRCTRRSVDRSGGADPVTFGPGRCRCDQV
jgi:hypothetical protein